MRDRSVMDGVRTDVAFDTSGWWKVLRHAGLMGVGLGDGGMYAHSTRLARQRTVDSRKRVPD